MSNKQNNVIRIVDNINFPELIKRQNDRAYLKGAIDEPFFICDLGEIVSKHKLWQSRLPRVEPFFAMKSNPDPLIVFVLAKMGLGFDCASRSEIAHVLSLNVTPDRILYANPCKHPSFITFAAMHNVQKLVFDSVPELEKIAIYYPGAELILRIFVGASKARCPLGLKFGAFIHEVPHLLETALALNLNVIGVSFHVGSGCFDPDAYREAIVLSHVAFSEAEKRGISFTLLDIGGGFPGNLSSPEKLAFFDKVAETINQSLDEYFPVHRGIRIVAEPGRYYVSSSFQLATSITSVRPIQRTASDPPGYSYFLNDGVYGSFNCTYFDHFIGDHYLLDDCFAPVPQDLQGEIDTHPSIFWGPSCDSMDKILENFNIRKLKIGDCVVFKDMGAYTMAAASTFNGFEKPYIVYSVASDIWCSLQPLVGDFPIEIIVDVKNISDGSIDESLVAQDDTKVSTND